MFSRTRNRRPQYRLRLESGRCLTYYEVRQHDQKARRGDLILAIYGSLRMAEQYCERYNTEWAWLDMKATIWAYWGSKPICQVTDGQERSVAELRNIAKLPILRE